MQSSELGDTASNALLSNRSSAVAASSEESKSTAVGVMSEQQTISMPSQPANDVPLSEASLNAITPLEKHLTESGEYQKLSLWTSEMLLKSGWKEDMVGHCYQYIHEKKLENINDSQELINHLRVIGRSTVPSDIKAELLNRIGHIANTQFSKT